VRHENIGWFKTSQVNCRDGLLAPHRVAHGRLRSRGSWPARTLIPRTRRRPRRAPALLWA